MFYSPNMPASVYVNPHVDLAYQQAVIIIRLSWLNVSQLLYPKTYMHINIQS